MVKSFTTMGVIAAGLTLAMSAALAAPNANGEKTLSIEPGAWEWTHETMLGPAPISSTSVQCVEPDDASVSLDEITEDLAGQCSMADIAETDEGYSFKLNCHGDIKGIATGKIVSGDKTIALTASGAASVYGMTAPFTISANAKHIGECQS